MAILRVLKYGDPILREKSKEVSKVNKKVLQLVDDLFDTMYAKNGVGLAAPQIGVNLRVFVIDTAFGNEKPRPIVFINPKILKLEHPINSYEGCLSFPDAYTNVRRYKYVKVKAINTKGRPFIIEEEGTLLAKAIQHEYDHLDGKLFVDHCRNRFDTDAILAEKGLPPVDSNYLLDENDIESQIDDTETKEEDKE